MDGFLDPSRLTTCGTEYGEVIVSFQTLGGMEYGSMGIMMEWVWEMQYEIMTEKTEWSMGSRRNGDRMNLVMCV